MASLHQSTWKKAGIFEAVMNSKNHIQKDQSLVLEITERWCSETKTFVFPWGEATVTLEDVIVLGGYSVLGDSVLSPAESEELQDVEKNLKEARRRIVATKAKKACQSVWIKTFMNSGKELEHQAFLACWLSRYVFAGVHDTISEHVFPVAIQLARGTRIALAPAVLASIYRDLSLLKEKIVVATNSKSCKDVKDGVLELTLRSPFYLVQIWVWERFIELQPKPNVLNYGDLRMARWDKVNGLKVENVRLSLELAGEGFLWRPYAMAMGGWKFPKFYSEKEIWVPVGVGPGLDEELLSFARCMRVSELVGFGCIEQYLPHRVAMQFGMDQDLPGFVPRLNEFPDIAWNDYCKPISDERLYIPPRLFKAGITARYLDWKQSMFDQQETSKSIVPEKRRLNGSKTSLQSLTKKKRAKDIVVPHIPPKGSKSLEHCSIGQLQTLSCSSGQDLEIPGLALEKRIIRLEKVIAELKAARFGSKFSKKSKKGHSST